MRFFLAAPLSSNPRSETTPTTARHSGQRRPKFVRSLEDSHSIELEHISTEVPAETLIRGEFDPRVQNETVTVVQCGAVRTLAIVVNVIETPTSVKELEDLLSAHAAQVLLCATDVINCHIMWVCRTLLLGPRENAPKDWLEPGFLTVFRPSDGLNDPKPLANLGWGNNIFYVDSDFVPTSPPLMMAGIIDAQVLWVEIDQLSSDVTAVVHEVLDAQRAVSRREYENGLFRLQAVSARIARHNVRHDDLLLLIQGRRRAVGATLLSAWDYDNLVQRVTRRVNDVQDVISQKQARLDRKYQKVVELVLLGLGLITLADLVLSVISTAYSGAVATFPGRSSGFFAAVRSADADILLGAALIAMLAVIAFILGTRRNR